MSRRSIARVLAVAIVCGVPLLLFVPVTLEPRQTEEFVSEYLLLTDVPANTPVFGVTYRFPSPAPQATR